MANEENLKPWKPGQSGNPHGVPAEVVRKRNEAADIAAQLILDGVAGVAETVAGLRKGDKNGEMVANLVDEKLALLKEAQDRAYGKPKQSSEISGPDGASVGIGVTVNFTEPDDEPDAG